MTIFASRLRSSRSGSKLGAMLQAYYGSGWAFLIPYLTAYLLYAWLHWPVSPVDGGQWAVIPCLLHVYWALHAINLILAGIALRAWWKASGATVAGATDDSDNTALRTTASQPLVSPKSDVGGSTDSPSTVHRAAPSPPSTVPQSGNCPPSGMNRLWAAMPWLCLAAVFYTPGVYMEFPADPWHHYARVNEWSWLPTVMEHSAWKKSSYFLGYSLIGHVSPPAFQLKWFDVFYTGCCLLLCWQYFRLARAVGFGARSSFIFVLIQAITFGNNIFGFYRYYGMSSTLFAQLGAVALTRIALEALREKPEFVSQPAVLRSLFSVLWRPPGLIPILPTPVFGLLQLAGAGIFLLPLIAFNHVQGLGIAGLGIAAVIGWRLIEWRRSMIGWLALAAVILSAATVLWFPRHPALDEIYRPQGWLTSWYGFNLFQPSSPAFDRAAAIIDLLGLLNLVAAVLLLRSNSIAAWLTLLPIIVLSLPSAAIPFANILAVTSATGEGGIIVFNRLLLAIPAGLALVASAAGWLKRTGNRLPAPATLGESPPGHPASIIGSATFIAPPSVAFTLMLFTLFALTTVPAAHRYNNRLYHVLMMPADDLAMNHVIRSPAVLPSSKDSRSDVSVEVLAQNILERGNVLTTPGIGYVMNATGVTLIGGARRWMTWPTSTPPSLTTAAVRENLQYIESARLLKVPFHPTVHMYTATSMTGYLSKHWLWNEVALEHAAQAELFEPVLKLASTPRRPQLWLEWFSPRNNKQFFAPGAGRFIESSDLENRGRLDNGTGDQLIRAGDLLTIRPFLRTLDGDGWRVTITVQGPGGLSHRDFTGHPSVLGGDNWIFGDSQHRLNQPGEYTVDLSGTTLWPTRTFSVRYHFVVLLNNR